MFKEFKEFAAGGNMVDLAVGFVMGGAFATIVTSFVNDIIMPIIGYLMGGIDFRNFYTILKGDGPYASLTAAQEAGAITINWGVFINAVISFIIIAFVLFMVIRSVNKMKKAKEEEASGPSEVDLLIEIRDNLNK